MFRLLPTATIVSVLIGSGVVHGLWTYRWGKPPDWAAAAQRLEQVPMTIGDWDAEPFELSADQLAGAEAEGHLARRYIDRSNGTVVTVLIVCGRTGAIAVHPPDVCYRGAGYDLSTPPARYPIPDPPHGRPLDFITAKFLKSDAPVPSGLQIFWSWSADGDWKAPRFPRMTFAHFPVLYKLYVIQESSPDTEPLEDSPCVRFIRELIPELETTLFENKERGEP